ncbi:hypothetical protein OUZ56_007992 [Daphnia magna]|uniref:Uncharacterized protein n=1 Tax=Daphnia magna TaxID=35525 RepID=A0ABR0AC03_9CRUS|nr:hypothetical protein OUZ56_007992 [Daphnia magna]
METNKTCSEDVNVSNKTAKQNKNEKDGESKRKRTDDKWALQVRQVGRYIAQQDFHLFIFFFSLFKI